MTALKNKINALSLIITKYKHIIILKTEKKIITKVETEAS